MEDFYFAYDYENNEASRLCRFINSKFEQYNKEKGVWEANNELCCIFIGEDIFYTELTEAQANEVIKNM